MCNRLIHEDSPYLRQHAKNPVDWYPWGDEAFTKARLENKLIFLSIGYSSCHWCHVMEKECFEDRNIAELLNRNFVSIKVDREERPDIDKHFQEIFVTMNGRAGGWPLSIFMTHEKIPIYSATYIPPKPKYGMMGFGELLEILADKYAKDRKSLIDKGREVLEFLKPKKQIQATRIDLRLESIVIKQMKQVYDAKYGGFGGAPKFPHASTLRLALALVQLRRDEALEGILHQTLSSMALGGLYDLVDGGFCRYSTDEKWLVPHFEKMSYDNALLAELYAKASAVLDREEYWQIAQETLEFMLERMMHRDLFFSASDADSDGEEGKYFVYDYDEALEAFEQAGIADYKQVAKRLGMSEKGNFEGKNIPRLSRFEDRNDRQIRQALSALKSLRARRNYPFIDRKIQSSWNAMVIRALFVAGRKDRRYLKQAVRSLEALEDKMALGVRLFHSALIDSEPKIEGFLEDYAWWISALMEGYRSTLKERYLIRAIELANEAIRRFYDHGRWRIDDGEFQEICDDTDTGYPSALAVIIEALQGLCALVDPVYEKFIARTLEIHSYQLMRQAIARATLAQAAIRSLHDDLVVKATPKYLESHIDEIDTIGYPWFWLRGSLESGYLLCGTKSCFAHEESFWMIKKAIEHWKEASIE